MSSNNANSLPAFSWSSIPTTCRCCISLSIRQLIKSLNVATLFRRIISKSRSFILDDCPAAAIDCFCSSVIQPTEYSFTSSPFCKSINEMSSSLLTFILIKCTSSNGLVFPSPTFQMAKSKTTLLNYIIIVHLKCANRIWSCVIKQVFANVCFYRKVCSTPVFGFFIP